MERYKSFIFFGFACKRINIENPQLREIETETPTALLENVFSSCNWREPALSTVSCYDGL